MRASCVLLFALVGACSSKVSSSADDATTPAPAMVSAPAIPECLPCDELEGGATSTDGNDTLRLRAVGFDTISGWDEDQQELALASFGRSCARLASRDPDESAGTGPFAGRVGDWQAVCRALDDEAPSTREEARRFFEGQFRAYEAHGREGREGKFTGYYLQPLRASTTPSSRYAFPLYRKPADLVEMPLSEFVADGRSRRLWGRIDAESQSFHPYPERMAWLEERNRAPGDVLLWVDDPADAVAIEIEGSGVAELDDGRKVYVSFAGKNGRPSGRLGSIHRAMKALRTSHRGDSWSAAEMNRYWEVISQKTSMVFFQFDEREGAIGTQEVVLSPGRSAAVDRAVIPLSAPVWVSTRAPSKAGGPAGLWKRLLIAQDTGGAIVGSVRVDIYTGEDEEAFDIGRRINSRGELWVLLPRSIEISPAYLLGGT